jgi:hypothetical protein
MGANCDYAGVGPTIATSLFDRTNMLSRIWYHDYLGNATADSGIKYVLGETNSISCQGAFNISDVMASAVWAIDYVMYLSSLKVSRVHFHMGTRYRYAKISRLTNPGIDIANNITFAGQYVNQYGRIVGDKTYDKVFDGAVLVGAGEAVLVQL